VKYQGTGNDFIIVNAWNDPVNLSNDTVKHLCSRHFGVGGDGLMMIRPMSGFDFEMVYYNADGNPGSMCGNGGRCLVDFAVASGLVKSPQVRFLASDGPHEAIVLQPGLVRLRMVDVNELEQVEGGYWLDTGSPHFVTCVEDIQSLDVLTEGRKVRYGSRYADKGVNVNFMNWSDGTLHVRTYERGVEAETLSCGTGVTASALLAHRLGLTSGSTDCKISTLGGDLTVSFEPQGTGFRNIWLEGPATLVFKGEMDL
jgi:diaminopimelate epimerase